MPAAAVLEVSRCRPPAVFSHAHHRAAEAGLGVLDDQAGLGLDLRRASRSPLSVGGEHVAAVPVHRRQPARSGSHPSRRRAAVTVGRGVAARRDARRTLGTRPSGVPARSGVADHIVEEVRVLEDRKLDVLRAIVEDYVSTQEPVGLQGPRRAAQPGRLAGHDPQRHGRAGGRGLHRPAAHQRRADPHRQGLPAVRRPALVGQAAVRGRAPRDPVRSSTAPSTSTTSSTAPCGCSPSSPARSRSSSTPRCPARRVRHVELVPLGAEPAARRAHHQHRPGRAAGRRVPAPRSPDSLLGRAARPAQRRDGRACGSPTLPAALADLPDRFTDDQRPAVAACSSRAAGEPGRGARGAGGAGRHRQPRPVRPGLPADDPARARGARGAGRAAAAARRGHRPVGAAGADRPREPARRARPAPRW